MKKLFLVSFLLSLLINVRADYFEKLPYTIKQPDGQIINCFISGDEYYSRIHDWNDFTILRAPDGYYYYAVQDGDFQKPSGFVVGRVDPFASGLKKGLRISAAEYRSRFDQRNTYRTAKKGVAEETAPQTGILINVVIYIRFADDAEFSQPRQYYYNSFNPSTGFTLRSYFREVSYNKLEINSMHYPACDAGINVSYKDYRKRSFFEPFNETANPEGYKNYDEKTLREHSLLADAVTWINESSPVSKDLDLDINSDGMVDNVCFIVRGGSGTWNELLWSHRWALYSKDVSINGKKVYSYTFLPEGQVTVKTLCHEMFHTLGAPDLYHYENQGAINPVGCWDIMEGGTSHMTAYMKWKYSGKSWIPEIPEIKTSGTYRLNPVTSPEGNCYRIKSPASENEFFVIEYRKRSGTFEINLPGSGLIVSRIDPQQKGNSYGPPDEIYIYRPGGTTAANGECNEAFLSASSGRNMINDLTNPGSFLQNGNPGGLYISDIREEAGQIVFNVVLQTATSQEPDPAIQEPRVSVLTSAKDEERINFSVYPNPSADYINLKIEETTGPVQIEIRDLKGNLLYSEEPDGNRSGSTINIDISDKLPGMYLVEVRTKKFRKAVNVIKL
ncbi:MAG TPA: M6 family metalloprotease domain-containing protein [Bacteroidales bacterium]|nr:M6 family metalloprotease domain-containing protein [Bacteroidales bacterium]